MPNYLAPGFMKEFCCVAEACDDNCCHGWRVDIDKDTYQAYRQCRDPELGGELRAKTARAGDTADGGRYAKILMTEEGNCPFLSGEGLCRIQRKLGEGMLSRTCRRYPRVVHSIGGVLEMTAQLSCPAVARAALLPPEPMAFSVMASDRDCPPNAVFAPPEQPDKPGHYFAELRAFGISVLQNRVYTVPERLVLLGMFLRQLPENGALIPSLISAANKQYGKAEETKEQLGIIQAVPGLQIQLLKLIVDHKKKASSLKYQDIYRRALLGLGYTGASDGQILNNYLSGIERYVKPFFSGHGHMIEHVLVHEYFLMMMPFGAFPSAWDAYVYLVMLYGMIKFIMAGVAREQGRLDAQTVLSIVQSLTREILHNEQLILQIIRILHENELDTPAYMTILALH